MANFFSTSGKSIVYQDIIDNKHQFPRAAAAPNASDVEDRHYESRSLNTENVVGYLLEVYKAGQTNNYCYANIDDLLTALETLDPLLCYPCALIKQDKRVYRLDISRLLQNMEAKCVFCGKLNPEISHPADDYYAVQEYTTCTAHKDEDFWTFILLKLHLSLLTDNDDESEAIYDEFYSYKDYFDKYPKMYKYLCKDVDPSIFSIEFDEDKVYALTEVYTSMRIEYETSHSCDAQFTKVYEYLEEYFAKSNFNMKYKKIIEDMYAIFQDEYKIEHA